jgi:S1-C subfamily serine protease
MVTGGLVLDDASAAERKAAGIADGDLALRVKHVGQYNAHAVAKNSGFLEGDLLVALDGRTERMTESQWFVSLLARTKPGDSVKVKLRRGSETLELKLPMQ